MAYNNQSFQNDYENYTDYALRQIIYQNAADYENYAIEAAKAELNKRYEQLFSQSSDDNITLKLLFKYTDFEEITDCLIKAGERKKEFLQYDNAYSAIQSLDSNTDLKIILRFSQQGKASDRLDVFCDFPDQAYEIDIALLVWKEWLSASVPKAQILQYGQGPILTACLMKMTENGFHENDTKQLLRELEQTFPNPVTVTENEDFPQPDASADTSFVAQGLFDFRESKRVGDFTSTETFPDNDQPRSPQIRPFVRFLARTIDCSYFSVIVGLTLKAVSPQAFTSYKSVEYVSISLIGWIFCEAFLLSTIGTTFGKWLLRITIKNEDGSALTIKQSLLRSTFVWACGIGCGIVYLDFVAEIFSFFYLKSKGKTIWDSKLHIYVSHEPIGIIRGILAAFLFLLPGFIIFASQHGFNFLAF